MAPGVDAATSPPDTAAPDAGSPPAPLRLVTALAAGVEVPWFVGVGPSGAAAPLRLGPRRGAGYQRAAGTVSYPQLTPDGATVVVVYQEVGGDPVLFALPADGSGAEAPIRVAAAPGLSALDRSYAGGQVAFAAEGGLYAAALDGSDPTPRLLASGRIEHPMWVTGTAWVAYLVVDEAGSRVWTVAEGEPVDLSSTGTTLEWLVAPLPGGRVLARGADDRLYSIAAEGGTPVPLTPPGRPTTFEGLAGGRVVAELRTQGSDLRELVSVSADGDGALVVLTPEPSTTLDVAVQRDGERVAWSARGDGEKWAAFEGPAGGAGSQITAWNGKRIHVTSYAGDVIAGATEEGRVLRFFLPGGPTAKSQVVHDVGPIVNMSYPWPVVSTGATHLLYQANTPDGWRSWVLPAAGGTPTALGGAWTWDLITPYGVVTREAVSLGAAAATSPTEEPRLLTPWHEAPLIAPRTEGGWFVYGCEAPAPGWYAVSSDGGGPAVPALTGGGASEAPSLVAGALVRVVGTTLVGVTLDVAGHGAPRTLLTGVTGRPLPLPDAGVVVAPQGARVVSQPVLGGEPILVLDAGATVLGLYPMPGGERVLALSVQESSYTPELHAARIDGTEALSPLAVGALSGWVLSVTPTPDGGRVLAEVSIEATAVPHPDALVTAVVGPDPPEAVVIAKLPVGRWGSPPPGLSFERPEGSPLVVTADGSRVILQGPDGLLSAPTDASAEPALLGPATGFVGVALTPHGVLASAGGSLTLADPGVAGSQRVIAEGLPTPLGNALLVDDRLVLRAGQGVVLVALDTGAVTPLVEGDVGALLSSSPDGEAALIALGARLALVPLSPPPTPALVARPGDATDAFVGWLP
ncbi:MAG: hypothetical protein AMXMBFR64_01660 [Myxococcales bacterium]